MIRIENEENEELEEIESPLLTKTFRSRILAPF